MTLGTGVGVFKPGYDKELDQLSAAATTGEAQVEAYQEKLKGETGIASLREHRAYIDGLGTAFDPDAFLRGNARAVGEAAGCEYAIGFEVFDI